MRVVVTGGAGYIGSVVVARLVGSGHAVTVVDDLSKGHREAVSDGAALAVCDLGDPTALGSIFKEFAPDAVVHLAARSLVGESMASPGTYYRQNVTNTLNVLEAMDAAGCGSIVFSSTAAVYGEPGLAVGGPGIVEETPTAPTNVYGETKLAAERMIGWYAVTRGFRTIALRYFNASGAYDGLGEDHRPEAHLIPNVLRVALGQAPNIAVYGGDHPTPDGTPIRDYVHVSDLAAAHIRALEVLDAGTVRNDTLNLGTGSGFSVAQIVETARRVTGHAIPTVTTGRRAGDPPVLVASAVRARTVLGWNPLESSIEAIIGSAWEWHKAHPHGYSSSR
jgi:UDP-glucose 4-epimerase